MIIAITDAKGLTNIVEREKSQGKDVSDIYKQLFTNHLAKLTSPNVRWKLIKTTGDGLLITTACANRNTDFFMAWIRAMYDLYEQCTPEIRIVAHYCAEGELIRDLKLRRRLNNTCIDALSVFIKHLRHDIFGPEVNLLFRLAQAASTRTFLVTDEFVATLVTDSLRDRFAAKQQFRQENFTFGPPVPITHVKGIERVGFSSGATKPKPIWLWEINKAA